MPKKSTVTVDAEDGKPPVRSSTALVRVEDSIDDFIKSQLPTYPKAKLQVCPLWTRDGRAYYRCKFWQYDTSSVVVTRKEAHSHFVCVESVNAKRVLTDLTGKDLLAQPLKGLVA